MKSPKKARSKVAVEARRLPSPYDSATHKTERTGVAILMHWMRQIIEEKNLDLGLPDVETSGSDRKMPDLVIYESRGSDQVLCPIEAKQPFWDVFAPELVDDARKKANGRKARFFATTNFRDLVWWKTREANDPTLPLEQQIAGRYELSRIEDLTQLEQVRFSDPTRRALERFLVKLSEVHTGREPEPALAVDELLVYLLHEKVRVLAKCYRDVIEERYGSDPAFARQLARWFSEQNWNFPRQPQDFDKAARQAAYLLVNKLLFYSALQAKRPGQLDPLEIPAGLTKGAMLQTTLQGYFSQVLKIDYETVFSTDFIDSVAFPDRREVVEEVKRLVAALHRYNFATLGFDIVGRIFERLIPQGERHDFGQYFTGPDVVDIILRFCVRHESDKVLDPACGAGTFLVRAYQHKKLMNRRLEHTELLETLWGNDIAKFPAHLATINLAINDLSVDDNYPNVIHEDFFALAVGDEGFELPERTRRRRTLTLGKAGREVTYPRRFDAIVGNPPYTRQEEIPDIGVDKAKLIERALTHGTRKLASIGRRAGIHAYFFVHGWKFLRDGGRFGFIVSNSWLDVDYGKGLQEFFLGNYKVVAIIESKVERWFEDADVNTCIVILEKCADKKARDANLVRFVYLKKPLRYFVPAAQDMWDKQVARLQAIDEFIKTGMFHTAFYENDDLRVFPIAQSALRAEGFDADKREYVGAKWGKYLRAPRIFFRVLEKGRRKLVRLGDIAEVRFGVKTGADEFFYLTEDEIGRLRIEREFWMHKDPDGKWVPNYVMKSPRDSEGIVVDTSDLALRVLMVHAKRDKLRGSSVLKYITHGERPGARYDTRPTCASREPGRPWYDLGEDVNDQIAFPERTRLRHLVFYNPARASLNKNLYGVRLRSRHDPRLVAVVLNTTLTPLCLELFARQPGGGGGPLDVDVRVAAEVLLPRLELLSPLRARIAKCALPDRPIGSIFDELGATDPATVTLDGVKPDRRELDRIVMGEILGLTDEEQLEVYRAVVDLVKSRIERAKSVGQRGRTQEGIDVDALKGTIVARVKEEAES